MNRRRIEGRLAETGLWGGATSLKGPRLAPSLRSNTSAGRQNASPASSPRLRSFCALCVLLWLTNATAATNYVWQGSPNPTTPYSSWDTAAHVIQDAVDAAADGDTVLVTNGVYMTGRRAVHGTMFNRVVVNKPLQLLSVNGPEVTTIEGYQVPGTANGDGAIRCVYLADGATISGFTLTNGATRSEGDWEEERSGGGIWSESSSSVVTNCVLTGNSAAGSGGGAYLGTLNNCTLTGNSADRGGGASGDFYYWFPQIVVLNNCVLTDNSAMYGGGTYRGNLNNCTLTGNSADDGGGADSCRLRNCIAYYNAARFRADNYLDSTLTSRCITCRWRV